MMLKLVCGCGKPEDIETCSGSEESLTNAFSALLTGVPRASNTPVLFFLASCFTKLQRSSRHREVYMPCNEATNKVVCMATFWVRVCIHESDQARSQAHMIAATAVATRVESHRT